jgi:hypothetical protein
MIKFIHGELTMTKPIRLSVLVLLCGLSGAWKTNFKLTNKFAGDSSEKYPANEKDYAYLFCENGEDADRSQKGKADWRRSTSHEYCWNEHRGSDDTWKSGWERSRLMRGCKNQLNFFGNKIYRCYDITKDPEFSQIEQSLTAEKKQAYDEWLKIYNAKVDELYKGANQSFGDIDAELGMAREKEARAKAVKEKMEQDAALAKRNIDELSARHGQLEKLLSSLVVQFDIGWESLLAKSDKLSLDIDAATSRMKAFRSRIKASDQSHNSLATIQAEAVASLDQSYGVLCKGLETGRDVENLRSQVGYMNRLIGPVLADAEAVHIPPAFSEARKVMLGKIQSLYEVAGKRDFIFDSSYDVLSEDPAVCTEINMFLTDLGKAVGFAKRAEEIKKTIGVIADLEAALKQIDQEYEAAAQYNAAILAARDIEVEWGDHLLAGRVAKARALVENLEPAFARIMSAPSLLASTVDRKKLAAELDTYKARIRDEANYRVSLNGAHGLLYTRLREIKTLIMKLEIKSRQNTRLNSVWSLQKQDIFSVLNTKPGKDIESPIFKEWAPLLDYEKMLDGIAATTDQLLLQNQ